MNINRNQVAQKDSDIPHEPRDLELGARLYTVLQLVMAARAYELVSDAFVALGEADVEESAPNLDLGHLESVLQALEDFLYDYGAFPVESEVPVPVGLHCLTEDEVWQATGEVLKILDEEGTDPLAISKEDLVRRCLDQISQVLSTRSSPGGSLSG